MGKPSSSVLNSSVVTDLMKLFKGGKDFEHPEVRKIEICRTQDGKCIVENVC